MRDIKHILRFRSDISPFLVHLTRRHNSDGLQERLELIVRDKSLVVGDTEVSDVRFGGNTIEMEAEDRKRFFGAVCFTETPLNEIHCLLEIAYRQVNLEPYGLVFLKEQLQKRGVAPVLYLNNECGDQDPVVRALFGLIETDPEAAEKLLPLVSVFGKKLQPPGARPQEGTLDFIWEREWRFPAASGTLDFSETDVFIGLCPEDNISYFERLLPGIGFVDPRMNMKWHATKLIEARQRLDLKHSVV